MRKDNSFNLRCSSTELEEWKARARDAGLSVSDWIRRCVSMASFDFPPGSAGLKPNAPAKTTKPSEPKESGAIAPKKRSPEAQKLAEALGLDEHGRLAPHVFKCQKGDKCQCAEHREYKRKLYER